jgi:hypothetical protein
VKGGRREGLLRLSGGRVKELKLLYGVIINWGKGRFHESFGSTSNTA